jgi:PqqD family protein of HPr-rel-A system
LSELSASTPDTLRHEALGTLHAVFDCVSGKTHFVSPEMWQILLAIAEPRSRSGHMRYLKETFDVVADGGDADQVLQARLEELSRLGLLHPVS